MNRKIIFLPSFITVLSFCCVLGFHTASAQTTTSGEPHDSELYKTIVHMDSVMFDAFNTHNLTVMGSVFAENVEFYHDKGGLTDYPTTMNNFKKLAVQTPGLRRELVKGTMEVYPVPGYGAVEIGEHRFTHMENGKEVAGIFKFIQVWQYKDGAWKVTREISVGH